MEERTIDCLITDADMDMLRRLVGQDLLVMHTHDIFPDDKLYFSLQLDTEDFSCTISGKLVVVDYYGAPEDLSALTVSEEPIVAECDRLSSKTVCKTVRNIEVVNYLMRQWKDGTDCRYTQKMTNGIIITFDDGSQLSVEKMGEFEEFIVVDEGSSLLDRFEPIEGYSSPELLDTEAEDPSLWHFDNNVEIVTL